MSEYPFFLKKSLYKLNSIEFNEENREKKINILYILYIRTNN